MLKIDALVPLFTGNTFMYCWHSGLTCGLGILFNFIKDMLFVKLKTPCGPLGGQNLNAVTRLISLSELLLAQSLEKVQGAMYRDDLDRLNMLLFTLLRKGNLEAADNRLVSRLDISMGLRRK